MNDDNEANTEPERPAVRVPFKRSDRDNIIETIGKLNRYASPKIDLDKLSQLSLLSEIDFNKKVVSIMCAIDKAMDEPAAYPEVESPEVMVGNLERFQKSKSTYFHWDKSALLKLTEQLQ